MLKRLLRKDYPKVTSKSQDMFVQVLDTQSFLQQRQVDYLPRYTSLKTYQPKSQFSTRSSLLYQKVAFIRPQSIALFSTKASDNEKVSESNIKGAKEQLQDGLIQSLIQNVPSYIISLSGTVFLATLNAIKLRVPTKSKFLDETNKLLLLLSSNEKNIQKFHQIYYFSNEEATGKREKLKIRIKQAKALRNQSEILSEGQEDIDKQLKIIESLQNNPILKIRHSKILEELNGKPELIKKYLISQILLIKRIIYKCEAEIAYLMENTPLALEKYELTLQSNNEDIVALNNKGVILSEVGNKKQALEIYNMIWLC